MSPCGTREEPVEPDARPSTQPASGAAGPARGAPPDHAASPVAGGEPDGTAARILARLEMWGQKLGLERIRAVLERLDHPERSAPAVLVAGTNGKGSTSALIAAICHAAGYRTGLYTSPHLEDVEERIRIDGRTITTTALGARLEEVLSASPVLPTYFEALTAAAFLEFQRAQVDVAVLEVGLGGRLDATNVAEPLLSVITQLSLDHQEHLGCSLREIAGEKAGIMRPDRAALSWSAGDSEVAAALGASARERGARLEDSSHAVAVDRGAPLAEPGGAVAGAERWAFEMTTARRWYRLETALIGRHQGPNLALAVRAAEELSDAGFARIDAAAIRAGVARCRWPGRLERVRLPDGRRVLLDAAHNPGGVEALLEYLAEHQPAGPLDLLYGSLRDKGAELSLRRLAGAVRAITLTEPPSERALEPAALADQAPAGRIEPDPERALERALEALAPGETLLVCGSIYLTGAVRRALHHRCGVPTRAVEVATS